MNEKRRFTDATLFLGTMVTILIDRPLGSRHPREGFIYPLNYGYVPNTPAPDGDNLDAYLLGVFEPVATFTGRCIAVVRRRDDADDKLVVVPDGRGYTNAQIIALTEFQERFFDSVILRQAHD